jgi:ATP-dependent Clp protease ATP-binding subunit ClpA
MDYHFIAFYRLYHTIWIKLIRISIPVVLTIVIIVGNFAQSSPTFFLALFNIFVMVEIFYRYKISFMQSKKTLQEVEEKDALHVMTLPALSSMHASSLAYGVVKDLLKFPQVRFFLERAAISPQELAKNDMGNALLPQEAYSLAKSINGKRITTIDIMAAYLLLNEEKTQLLFNKKLKPKDIQRILQWTRLIYPQEEEHQRFHIESNGGGFGENLVIGWTPETKNYTRNFTNSLSERDVSIVGREKEYELIKEVLSKSENNNLVLVGEAGVGKEQLIQKLALDSYSGRINRELASKTILELMVGSLLAGATTQGDLQARIEAIIAEVSHAHNILLYIPDFQNMIGGGTFSLDLSGALAPYLKNGTLPIIASMTEGAYKTYLERSSLNQLFSPIKVAEVNEDLALLMVMEKTQEIEKKSSVIITYSGLVEAVRYADRYSQSMVLPGSAIGLLSDAVSGVLLTDAPLYPQSKRRLLQGDAVVKIVEQKTKIALSEPTQEEKNLLLHLEDVLHQHIVGQDAAVHVLGEAMRRLRVGIEERERPISFLFLGPTGVGKTETAKTLANTYFGGEATMIRLDMSEYADEEGQRRLLGSLPGQGDERGELTEQIRDHPYSLILLDEFEKAHSSIRDLFLQILEDGRLTDNKGRTISFINTIIIATSNAGSNFIHDEIGKGRTVDKQFESELSEYLQSHNIFKPELLNRFDAVVTFKPLSEAEVHTISGLLLNELKKKLAEKDINLEIDDAVLNKVSREAYNKEMGARPIRRYIQDTLEDLLSQKMLASTITRGGNVKLTVDSNNAFVIA